MTRQRSAEESGGAEGGCGLGIFFGELVVDVQPLGDHEEAEGEDADANADWRGDPKMRHGDEEEKEGGGEEANVPGEEGDGEGFAVAVNPDEYERDEEGEEGPDKAGETAEAFGLFVDGEGEGEHDGDGEGGGDGGGDDAPKGVSARGGDDGGDAGEGGEGEADEHDSEEDAAEFHGRASGLLGSFLRGVVL